MARKGKSTKLYYKIGEACKLLDIQPYVLRYWETEFPALKPSKSKSGQRVYSEKELEVIRRIKRLLYEEGYTIAGAKKKLEAEPEGDVEAPAAGNGHGGGSSEPAAGGAKLDTRGAEEIENLRAGIEKVLDEARELLAFLDSRAS